MIFSNGKWASCKTGFSNHPHLQHAVKSPIIFTLGTKTALWERAQLWLPSGVSARECSGTGRQRDKKGWREAGGTPGISKVLQDLAKERRMNKTNKNPFGAPRNKTQGRSSLFSVDANSFHLHTFKFPLHEVLQSCSLPSSQWGKGPFCPSATGSASDTNPGFTSGLVPQEHTAAWGAFPQDRAMGISQTPAGLWPQSSSKLCCFPTTDSLPRDEKGTIRVSWNGLGWKGP